MKKLNIALLLLTSVLLSDVYALETQNEKEEAATNEMEREVNKAGNRVKEAFCMESDVECLKEKALNRVEEGKEAVKDKASEIKNKADE